MVMPLRHLSINAIVFSEENRGRIASNVGRALRRDTDRIEMNETDLPDDATGTHDHSRFDDPGRRDRKTMQSGGAGRTPADGSKRPAQLSHSGGRVI